MNREAERTIRALAGHLGATREDLDRIARTLPESSVASLAEFAPETGHRELHPKESSTHAPVAPLVYTPTQAAKALGVSRQHIYNILARGELRSVQVGGRTRRIPLTELERLVSKGGGRDQTI
jgi:excisionase family DNA binding protein